MKRLTIGQLLRQMLLGIGSAGFVLCAAQITWAQGSTRDEVLADFENGTYQGWTLHGNCFGNEPASSALFPGQIEGFGGSRFLCTLPLRLGTSATGFAVSPEFTIDRPALRFRIGGGCYPSQACLNLVVDGKIVRTETGNGLPALYPNSWDVTAFRGKTAHLEVLDETTATDRGYIMVDDIVLGDPPRRAARGAGQSLPEEDAGADDRVHSVQAEFLGSPTLLKTFATLNAARLRAGLPLLALDPALMAAARDLATAKALHTVAPALPPGWQIDGLGAAQAEAPGGQRPLLDAGCRTVGLAAPSGGAGSRQLADWTVVYSRGEPVPGDVVALTVPSTGAASVPIDAGSLPGNVDVSAYRNVPVLPGWGATAPADLKPASPPPSVPAASASLACGLTVFPVLDGADWSDTFGAPRVGHKHQGEDLMAPKMRPLVACFSGVVTLKLATSPKSTAGNTIHLTNSKGWTAIYMHVNCDTPGTMDAKGGVRYAFAPGLKTGDHVHVGQFLGYTGDSGNARGGASHCHFELHPPRSAAIDPAAVLRVARILRSPGSASPPSGLSAALPATASPEFDSLPGAGEIQIEGALADASPGGLTLTADAVTLSGGSATPLSPPRTKDVGWAAPLPLPGGIYPGSRVIVVGRDSGPGTLLRASLLVFRL